MGFTPIQIYKLRFCQKNEKTKKVNFCWDQRRTRREKGERCIAMHFLFAKQIISWYLFYLEINIVFVIQKEELVKDKLHWGIKFIVQMWIPKIWMICEFLVPGEREDTCLTLRICCQHMNEKMHKIWPAIWFYPWDFRTCPHPKDISGACLGYFQLRCFLLAWQLHMIGSLCSSMDLLPLALDQMDSFF